MITQIIEAYRCVTARVTAAERCSFGVRSKLETTFPEIFQRLRQLEENRAKVLAGSITLTHSADR